MHDNAYFITNKPVGYNHKVLSLHGHPFKNLYKKIIAQMLSIQRIFSLKASSYSTSQYAYLASNQLEQCCFPSAIWTDKSNSRVQVDTKLEILVDWRLQIRHTQMHFQYISSAVHNGTTLINIAQGEVSEPLQMQLNDK